MGHWGSFVIGGLLLKAGRWDAAARVLRRATDLDPEHARSQHALAIALLKTGRWEDAAAAFRCTLHLDPDASEPRANLTAALLHLARWDEAAVVCRDAIGRDPDRAALHEHLGIALAKSGQWSPAVDALRRARALQPAAGDVTDLLCHALERLERWDELAEEYRQAVARDPTSAELHAKLGRAQMRLEHWGDAAQAFQRSLSVDPERTEVYLDLASALAKVPISDAEAVAAAPRTDGPEDAAALLRRAIHLIKHERWADAVRTLDAAPPLVPAHDVLRFLSVDPLVRLGRHAEALAAYHRAAAFGNERPPLPGGPPARELERRRAAFWSPSHLSPRVFVIDRWLGALAAATPGTEPAAGPDLLFVLDADYGELTTLMYLILGRPLYPRSALLLPDRLFKQNPDALPGRTYRYASVDDILEVAARLSPKAVFLCAGYLMPVHGLVSVDELHRLVTTLRVRGSRVVTADPFLGVLSHRNPRDLVAIDIPEQVDDESFRRRLVQLKEREEERLWTCFAGAERVLRQTHHVYPAYCDVPQRDRAPTDARNVSFFNDRLLCPDLVTPPPHLDASGPGRPHWLFILSRTDYEAQLLHQKPTVFVDIVIDKLLDALVAGRRPILIGPTELVQALGHRLPTAEGIDTLTYCPFTQFMSLLLSAEYAFYWNVLSHSLLIRLFNRLPTIVFDRGHLVRNVPAMYDRVVRWYYQGREPEFFDHRRSLTREAVAAAAQPYRRHADEILERFRRAPTPEAMVEAVLTDELPVFPGHAAGPGA